MKKGQFIRQPTHFFGFASLQRARAGCTLRVRFSYRKYHSPTQSVCAWSRASARSPLIAGPRYAVAASLLKLLIRKCLTQRCTLCNQVGGAVVRCSDCSAEYHISCAWSRGYKFGFEIQAVLLTISLCPTCDNLSPCRPNPLSASPAPRFLSTARLARCTPSCVAKSMRAGGDRSSTFVRQTSMARFVLPFHCSLIFNRRLILR